MFACQKATGKNKRKNEIKSDFLLKKTSNYNPELQSWEVMAFFHEKSPSELDFEHHSDIALYYRYKLLLLKNVSPSCCSQLLSTGVIYSMANPDAMNAYLPPWEGAGAEVSPLACRALTTALSLTGSHWSIPEVSSTQPRTKPHCDLPD